MIGINLIAPSVLEARCRKRRIQRWIYVCAIGSLVAAIPLSIEISRHQKVQSLKREKTMLATMIESTRSRLNESGIEIRNLEAQMGRANALRSKRPWSRLLALIADTLPQELWLVSLATDPSTSTVGYRDLTPIASPGVAGTDSAPQVVTMEAPRALVLQGYALHHKNLYEYMSRLKRSERFNDVSLTNASEEPVLGSTAVRFEVECTW